MTFLPVYSLFSKTLHLPREYFCSNGLSSFKKRLFLLISILLQRANSEHETALHLAAKFGLPDLLRLLLGSIGDILPTTVSKFTQNIFESICVETMLM